MIRAAARRLLLAPLLCAAGVLVALAGLFVMTLGRRGYDAEIASWLSCGLNAVTGGPRTATFSAYAALLLERGKPGAALRVRLIDVVNMTPGHCAGALADHRARGLLP